MKSSCVEIVDTKIGIRRSVAWGLRVSEGGTFDEPTNPVASRACSSKPFAWSGELIGGNDEQVEAVGPQGDRFGGAVGEPSLQRRGGHVHATLPRRWESSR